MNPLLMPVVAAQGIWVRSNTEKLPPAGGPSAGAVSTLEAGTDAPAPGALSGPPVRMGVLGESTAAGLGVDTHDEGFPGSFARELAERSGRPVDWQVVGQDAATARRIRYRLLEQLGKDLDVAVLLSGVNDTLTRRSTEDWRKDLEVILEGLVERAERVAMPSIPPFDAFPSLPGTLGRYLAERARALDEVSRQVCARYSQVTWIDSSSLLPVGPEFFGRDRFHPSAFGYRRWAAAVAEQVSL